MKMRRKTLRTLLMAAAASLLICFPAFGAELEGSFKATDNGVYGWAWNKGQFNDVVNVELQLDVYKRQIKYSHSRTCVFFINNRIRILVKHGIIVRGQLESKIIFSCQYSCASCNIVRHKVKINVLYVCVFVSPPSADPVSYTHLDVYKRQHIVGYK